MKKITSTILFAFVWSIGFTQSKQQVDSLLKLLNTEIADTTKLKVYTKIGNYYIDNNTDKAIEYFKNAINLSEKLNLNLAVAKNQNNIGYCYLLKGDFDKSLDYYFQSVRIFEKIKDSSRLAYAFMSIADVYFKNNDFKKTDEYHDKSQQIIESIKDNSLLCNFFISKAQIYDKRGLYDTSLQYAQKAYQLAIALKDDYLVASLLSDIGLTYKHQKKTTEALHNFESALIFFKKTGADPSALASIYNNMGATYAQADNYALAKEAFNKSISIATEAGIPYVAMEDYRNLSDMYGGIKNFELQAQYLKKYYTIKDSLFSVDNKNQLTQLEADYNIEQKNIEIMKQEGEVEKQKSQRNVFIIVALAAALLLTALGIFYSRIKKTNQLLEEKNIQINKQKDATQIALQDLKATQAQLIQSEKLASLGELTAGIAHEIQNPLNFVNNFSELSVDLANELKEEIDKIEIPEKDKNYIGEILTDLSQNQEKINHHGKRASSIVKGMLEHSRASTGVKELTDINKLADEYLRLSYHGLRAKDKDFNADFTTDFEENLPKIEVIPQDIGRVLLNLINNAFYAVNERANQLRSGNFESSPNVAAEQPYTPSVFVSTKQVRNAIEIRVKDNGIGMSEATKAKVFQPFFTTKPTGQGTGLGLSLAYDIVTKGHGGTLDVFSTEGVGTEFTIVLKEKIEIFGITK